MSQFSIEQGGQLAELFVAKLAVKQVDLELIVHVSRFFS